MRSSVIEGGLLQERDAGVLRLTLNRPARALGAGLISELSATSDDLLTTAHRRVGLAAARERRPPRFEGR